MRKTPILLLCCALLLSGCDHPDKTTCKRIPLGKIVSCTKHEGFFTDTETIVTDKGSVELENVPRFAPIGTEAYLVQHPINHKYYFT